MLPALFSVRQQHGILAGVTDFISLNTEGRPGFRIWTFQGLQKKILDSLIPKNL